MQTPPGAALNNDPPLARRGTSGPALAPYGSGSASSSSMPYLASAKASASVAKGPLASPSGMQPEKHDHQYHSPFQIRQGPTVRLSAGVAVVLGHPSALSGGERLSDAGRAYSSKPWPRRSGLRPRCDISRTRGLKMPRAHAVRECMPLGTSFAVRQLHSLVGRLAQTLRQPESQGQKGGAIQRRMDEDANPCVPAALHDVGKDECRWGQCHKHLPGECNVE